MIEAIVVAVCVLILVPFLAYTIAKAATTGYLSAKRMWNEPREEQHDKKE